MSDSPSESIRPFGVRRVGAPTGEEAAAFDAWAIQERGVPEPTLMENAGRAAALLLHRLHPRGPVVALVGSGNNGGDALVLLRTLASWGRRVSAVRVADRPGADPVLHGWSPGTLSDEDLRDDDEAYDLRLAGASVLVDGILGTGIRGAPRERQAAGVRALNRASAPVVALDVPSGVDAATGDVPGEAVDADLTVAFGWPKLGTLLQAGRERAGRLVAVEIGFPPAEEGPDFGARVTTPGWAALHRPRRAATTHKYSVGSLLLVAGRTGMAGAAVLAARAALASGVGLLHVASVPENRVILQEKVPEAIFVDAGDPEAMADAARSVDAVAAGPAVGTDDEAAERLTAVLDAARGRPTVLDADALTLAGAGAIPGLDALGSAGPVLLTPHPGEMARICDDPGDRIRETPVEVARKTAGGTGCTVLLKGLPSVVAPPEGPVMVDSVGSSDLAAGGMGDVLTGVCGSLLAQGIEAPVRAGALGLHHSGRAAARAGKGAGLTPSDVVARLPEALTEEGPGSTDLDYPFVVFDRDPPR